MFNIGPLEKLVHELNRLPGVGPKTAQRLAYHIMRTADLSHNLQDAMRQVRESVHLCTLCFSYTDAPDRCRLCTDAHRRDDALCVVEEPSDVVRVEASGAFRGRYHVLHGAISPLESVGPRDLKIQELLERVERGLAGAAPRIAELILALDPDLEGDTTCLYLARALADKQIKLTRIASGVPIGSDIDYVDDRTLGRALENRVEL
jgi:recombination protein RecR